MHRVIDKVAREWTETRDLIKKFLLEINPNQPHENAEHNASALIARLTHADYVIVKSDDVKG